MESEMFIKIVELIIALLSILITTYVVPYLKSKTDTEKLSQTLSWISTFVGAAEQMITESGKGEEKLALVTSWAKEKLKEIGVDLTDEQIRTLIEEAVHDLKKAI